MKVLLKGGLAQGTAPREIELAPGRALTREELVEALAQRVPAIQRYLAMSAETGRAPSLLILAGAAWVHPGDLVPEEATVEIHPPIAGGAAHLRCLISDGRSGRLPHQSTCQSEV